MATACTTTLTHKSIHFTPLPCPCQDLNECPHCISLLLQRVKTWRAQHQYIQRQLDQLQARTFTDALKSLQESLTQRENALKKRLIEIASLRSDLQVIRAKRAEEVTLIADLQRSKESFERELTDLSRRLFDEANQMVETERQQKCHLQQAHKMSRLNLAKAQAELRDTQEELRILRKDVQTDALEAFQNFAQQLSTTSLRRLHSLEYMKQCLTDDIEPCLRFGPNPYTASRKILDAILARTCVVEPLSEQSKTGNGPAVSLWERFLQPSGCQACGRDVTLTHRFRVSTFDEWACIDRYCRDRLVAVLAFYDFLRKLRAGCYRHRSMTDIYQEYVHMKLQMALSRQVQ
ncbi:hypothetical protein EC973_008035 [Apophysomyces ossiformis]|uniref:GDP/GTP exchange factor Sec2 N-terminal domain-containing protein n=1 Tax=Apophysomyces ossiformis TaxID=679940 RepID=A0A8H7EQJ7_9FUNG|nr:hypothetical protein EC973_008035 [Apophysomyces ossiformis]